MNISCYPVSMSATVCYALGTDGGHGVGPLLFLLSCIEGGPIPAVPTPCHPTSSSFLGSATSWQ